MLEKQVADFSWSFGSEFFLETSSGNYIWKSPDYYGDNTIESTALTHNEWVKKTNIPFSRSKGKHIIGEYCPGFTLIKKPS